jgi:CTP:molybdopterin cytidylyltransferase MocA
MAPLRGQSVLHWAVTAAVGAEADELVVVVGAVEPGDIDLPFEATVLVNPGWRDGQASSLQAAVAHGRAQGHGAMVVGLGDQPLLAPSAWRDVSRATDTPIAVATYGGRRGHPVRLAASIWHDLPDSGDTGAKGLLAARPDLVTEVECKGNPADIDTMEDLARWS